MGVGRRVGGGGGPGDIDAAIAAHEAKADPHAQYLTESEADALYDPIGAAAAALDRSNHIGTQLPSTIAGGNSGLAQFIAGVLTPIPAWAWDTSTTGLNVNVDQNVDAGSGGNAWNNLAVRFLPLQDSPNEQWNIWNYNFSIDPNESGFLFGTAGEAATLHNTFLNHQGTSDTGQLSVYKIGSTLGNGTDSITVAGINFFQAFGQIQSGATIDEQIQGFIFSPNMNAGSSLGAAAFVNAFGDFSQFNIAARGYTSFSASPEILSIQSGSNYTAYAAGGTFTELTGTGSYTGVGVFSTITEVNGFVQGLISSQTITELVGTAGYTGIGCFPTIGTTGFDSFHQGLGIRPTISNNRGTFVGLSVDAIAEVTNYPGAQSSVVIQDVTYTWNEFLDNNVWTIEYTDTVTAGNETISLVGQAIVIEIESGVSTAQQIVDALALNFQFSDAVDVQITGTASNPQTAVGPTNFTGGEDAGISRAAQFDGDVQINGALSFTGSLSLGEVDAFGDYAIVDGSGVPAAIHSLIQAPSLGDNLSRTNVDYIGVNTAMLLNVGENSSIASGFIGINALGLPAVLTMGAGSTLDSVAGALFAISLDALAGGGTVGEVNLCRALSIPNGVTTVNELRAFYFELPFGDVGNTVYGLYSEPASSIIYGAGSLVVGPTSTPSNASVAMEITGTEKAFLASRLTTAQRDALTAINGMVLYNSSTDKLQVYAGGTWVDLH